MMNLDSLELCLQKSECDLRGDASDLHLYKAQTLSCSSSSSKYENQGCVIACDLLASHIIHLFQSKLFSSEKDSYEAEIDDAFISFFISQVLHHCPLLLPLFVLVPFFNSQGMLINEDDERLLMSQGLFSGEFYSHSSQLKKKKGVARIPFAEEFVSYVVESHYTVPFLPPHRYLKRYNVKTLSFLF